MGFYGWRRSSWTTANLLDCCSLLGIEAKEESVDDSAETLPQRNGKPFRYARPFAYLAAETNCPST